MSNIDDLLNKIQEDKAQQSAKQPVKQEVVKENPVNTVVAKTPKVSLLNIFMFGTILVMGYFLYNNKHNSEPTLNIVEYTEKYENLYSTYKAKTYYKLADLVKDKNINNRSQLVKNAQAILEEARIISLGKIDELDNDNLPQESFEEKREDVVNYLKQKAEGYERAGK